MKVAFIALVSFAAVFAAPAVPDVLVPAVEPPKNPAVLPVIDCSTCDFGPYGRVQYLADPLNCNCFYQCQRLTEIDGSFTYIPHHQCCAPSLFWRQSWLTCVTDMFKVTENCIVQLPADVNTPEPATTPERICALGIVPGKPGFFLNEGIEQTCGTNMVFDFDLCTCIPGTDSDLICDSDVLLYYPFDEDLDDHSCTRATSTQTSEASVVLTSDVDRGTVAKFNGASSLHVGYIYNYFADRYVKQWSMAVWVKRTGNTAGLGGVINNGDCVEAPSFDIHVGGGDVTSCSVDTDSVSAMVAIQDVAITANVWEHVAMVYDGKDITMYRNASSVAHLAVQGNIENRQCPMNIGAQHAGSDYFEGLMDDIYIYERALSLDEITKLSKL
ncbi:hypothetical protein CAPTEDRAFT_216416 [Capitella teleta]|uniref:LamG-like jellyroll fold domain-containing protein n=1 Tax=Capitella teleta TaxID=283909 RepID=R7TDV5_CAPTE|nr:hypothetical protein CAPTEDRAFT_216416 [Capitella teleta]|eukprot:ELT91894.1 hypothetical protein CAPTEDRAFT_216416 [Capitella teleta]